MILYCNITMLVPFRKFRFTTTTTMKMKMKMKKETSFLIPLSL